MNKSLRVLIVEDSEDDALLLMRQLQNGGYAPEYVRVASGKDMGEALERDPWDIVIIDYAMPGFNALSALDLLKERGLDVPRIIVSGTIGEETAVETMKAGAHDYIMKDNLSRLVPAIERELREAQSRNERRKAEEALRMSEERYRCLVENIDIGVTLIDSDYNVIMTNEAQSRLYGKAARDVVGLKCYREFGNNESVCAQCPGRGAMDSGEPCEMDMQVPKEDRDPISLRVRSFPIFGEGGVVTGFIKVADDITERKRLEEQLRQAAQLEAIGRLAGGVAHDFNNLLTAMIGYSSVLLNQMQVNDPGRERVEQIRCAAERAAELTRQLLAFSRKQVLDVKVIDLNPLIADFQKIIRRLLGEDVEVATALDSSIGRVKADAGQIEQILMNLAVNARDAMPSGGKLTMETANVRLDKDYARTHPDVRPGPYVLIAVSDNGVGMDAETRAQIFDPFFTTKERGKGTGLGLSMVYGIVKQHQGHICVYSEPGRGTTFKVYLPLCEDTIRQADEIPAVPLPHVGTETVLVVEDDEIVLKLACEALEILGYTVLCAAHPQDALKIANEYKDPIQLLLTDVVLPQMDGPSLYKVLQPERPTLKVLYVSGYASNFIVHHGVLDAGVHFLQKPFTVEGLAAKIRETLEDESREMQ
jgi:two-component system, cell cycle sensor histidine kinase and response regulator CckA